MQVWFLPLWTCLWVEHFQVLFAFLWPEGTAKEAEETDSAPFLQVLTSLNWRVCSVFPWWDILEFGLFSQQDIILEIFISVWKQILYIYLLSHFNGFSLAVTPTTYQLKLDKWFEILISFLSVVGYTTASPQNELSFWVVVRVKKLTCVATIHSILHLLFLSLVDSFNYFLFLCWGRNILWQFQSTMLS